MSAWSGRPSEVSRRDCVVVLTAARASWTTSVARARLVVDSRNVVPSGPTVTAI